MRMTGSYRRFFQQSFNGNLCLPRQECKNYFFAELNCSGLITLVGKL